jgi:hypothetical protein
MFSFLSGIFLPGAIFAMALALIVFELARRRKLEIGAFYVSFFLAIVIFVLSVAPSSLTYLAAQLGLAYTFVAALFLGFGGLVLVQVYVFTKCSEHGRLINIVAQRVALIEYDLGELKSSRKGREKQ